MQPVECLFTANQVRLTAPAVNDIQRLRGGLDRGDFIMQSVCQNGAWNLMGLSVVISDCIRRRSRMLAQSGLDIIRASTPRKGRRVEGTSRC